MKKTIFLLVVGLVCSNAESINIERASNVTDRITPSKENVILSYGDSVKNAKKSVVNIATTSTVTINRNRDSDFMFNDPFFKQFFGGTPFTEQPRKRKTTSLGSGVIISSDGYIITNNHVVNRADEIVVTLSEGGKEYKAKIVGLDSKTDLAVIKIEEKNLQTIPFANSDNLQEGDVVFALGNPFGIGSTITMGIISALNKNGVLNNQYENFIQTDASINPGNSGGALIDSRGTLIGINIAILSRSGDNNGIGFATPSNTVIKIATLLVEGGKIERGFLGVSANDLTSDLKEVYKNQEGALIVNVEENSAAEKAKLKRGDLIVKIDDKPVKNSNELKNIIGDKKPNDKITITYERSGKLYTANIKLDKMEGDEIAAEASKDSGVIEGLSLENITDPSKYNLPKTTKGILVTKIVENSVGDKSGFREMDIIVQVGEYTVSSIDELKKTIQKFPKTKKPIYVSRGGSIVVLVVP